MGDAGRSQTQLLSNIVEWGDRMGRFIDGVSRDEFISDELRQAGVSKCIEVIGEASGEILRRYPAFEQSNPHLALMQAYRTRNRLSHGYETIDWEIVWSAATDHVPDLVAKVRSLLSKGVD